MPSSGRVITGLGRAYTRGVIIKRDTTIAPTGLLFLPQVFRGSIGNDAWGGFSSRRPRVLISSVSAEAAAFLARTSGLDTLHINAYTALINGLVADGVWAKLDVLYIFATQTSANALLNLISTSYNGTANGSPTFTADRGFTGTGANGSNIDTGFNPTTATTPKFVRDSAHISVWNVTDVAGSNPCIGAQDGANNSIYIIAKYGGGVTYFRNNTQNAGSGSTTPPNTTGHFLTNRTASTTTNNSRNGSVVETDATASAGIPNTKVYGLGSSLNSGTTGGTGNQQAMMSVGSGLTPTEAINFYNKVRTFMTAVGVP